jgi:hypothetical protein
VNTDDGSSRSHRARPSPIIGPEATPTTARAAR